MQQKCRYHHVIRFAARALPLGDPAMSSKPKAKIAPAVRSAIQTSSGHVQMAAAKSEKAALAAVDRAETAAASLKPALNTIKTVSTNLVEVVDTAGRTTLGSAVALNGSLMNYSKDLVTDTVELGRQTLQTRSLSDAMALQTAFTERRIHAAFETVAAVNALAQSNVLALWQPFAALLQTAGETANVAADAGSKSNLKTAA
jgi:hypothetical protein